MARRDTIRTLAGAFAAPLILHRPAFAQSDIPSWKTELHPLAPNVYAYIQGGGPTVEYATDTTRTIGSLVFSGAAARYANIRWIFSHGGGTLPFLVSRFEREEASAKEKQVNLPNGMRYELRKLYYEIAQANHPGALDALLRLVPLSQVLFGTDIPVALLRKLWMACWPTPFPIAHRLGFTEPSIRQASTRRA